MAAAGPVALAGILRHRICDGGSGHVHGTRRRRSGPASHAQRYGRDGRGVV